MDRYVPLPPLPPRIRRLNELAYDLWWSWNAEAREVFRDLDYPLWRFTDHNPVLLLHLVEPERLDHAAGDPEFLRLYDAAVAALDVVRAGAGTWWARRVSRVSQPIACVCPEFSLHQSLPLDSAGLGVVAGDYCKEASDLGVPLVGVGLMYPRGYAHQRLSGGGWQQESYEYLDGSDAPIGPALCPDGSRCALTVRLAGGDVRVDAWQVRAGRVTLYLLDTDLPENAPWDRELSSSSFDDDPDGCARRAVLLGAGAVRALAALGLEPSIWHVHESTSTFVALERLEHLTAAGLAWDDALARVRRSTLYNTRAAGPPRRDQMTFATVERHIAACWPGLAPLRPAVLALGRVEVDRGAFFSTAVFGARTAASINIPAHAGAGWREDSPDAPAHVSIAPGVHVASWIPRELATLFDRYVGGDWRDRQDDAAAWNVIREAPDEELWAVRQRLRGYLVEFARERARRRWSREQASGTRIVALGTLLDPAVLTIGFGRRFTEEARPDLIFQDAQRLATIVTASRRPVQIVFAGKAHPGDETGKHQLQRIVRRALDPMFGGRVAFIEDYDLHVARLLVQGCDVWLSTPRRDGVASMGGLKAAVSGVPHLSTPAGWWPEGWSGANGWVIEPARADGAGQDSADARALYRLLEEEIVPAFYDRERSGVPTRWTQMMKETIVSSIPRFCARRAVKATADRLYLSSSVVGP